MSVKAVLTYECDGCFKTAEVETGRLGSRFHGFNGKEHGFGSWVNEKPDAEALAPEGWMAWDPLTRCCYCPDCVEEIWPDPDERHGIRLVVTASTDTNQKESL